MGSVQPQAALNFRALLSERSLEHRHDHGMTFYVVDLYEMLIRDAVCCQYLPLRGHS